MRLNDLNLLVLLQLMQLVIFYSTTCIGLAHKYTSSNDISLSNAISQRNECLEKCDIKKERFEAGRREIHIGVLFPSNKSLLQGRNTVLGTILPVIELAVENITNTQYLLKSCTFKVHHKDTDCSSIYGPLAAFEMHALGHSGNFLMNIIVTIIGTCDFD